MIYTLPKQPTYYLVNVVNATEKQRANIKKSNNNKFFYDDDNHEWLRCRIKHIKIYVTPGGVSTSAVQAATSGTTSISIDAGNASMSTSSSGIGASASASLVSTHSAPVVYQVPFGKRPMYDHEDGHK